jgi:hypothetical protein
VKLPNRNPHPAPPSYRNHYITASPHHRPLRALSFMGLGGVLIGIGYAYKRLQPVAQEG